MADVCPACRGQLDPMLSVLSAQSGMTAAQWLWAPASGSPDHAVIAPAGQLVVHPTTGGSAALRGAPAALPLSDKSVGTLVVPLLLPLQEDIDGLFAELRRVLRPHGLLTMLVPTHPALGLRQRRLRGAMRGYWRHRSAVEHPDWLATAADFAVLGDDRLAFTGSVDTGGHRAVVDRFCSSGLYPPALPTELRRRVADLGAAQPDRPPRVVLRRLVTRR